MTAQPGRVEAAAVNVIGDNQFARMRGFTAPPATGISVLEQCQHPQRRVFRRLVTGGRGDRHPVQGRRGENEGDRVIMTRRNHNNGQLLCSL